MRFFLLFICLIASPLQAKQIPLVEALETCVELSHAEKYVVPAGWQLRAGAATLNCKSYANRRCGMMKSSESGIYLHVNTGKYLPDFAKSVCMSAQEHQGAGAAIFQGLKRRMDGFQTEAIVSAPKLKRFVEERRETLLCKDGRDPLLVITPRHLDTDPMSTHVSFEVYRMREKAIECEGGV